MPYRPAAAAAWWSALRRQIYLLLSLPFNLHI
jgi:hypothetical protein